MSFADALNEAGAKPSGKRPYFMERETERVLAITLAVAQELAVARQRIDTLERLLAAKGILAAGEIDAFAPDAVASAERSMWNQEYIARILRIVQQENEAALLADEPSSGELVEDLAQS